MQVNTNSQSAWASFDVNTVNNTTGGVAHLKSAVQDLRSMGEDTMHAALVIDRTVELAVDGAKAGGVGGAIIGGILGFLWDIGELILLPFDLIYKAINTTAHLTAAGVNAIGGKSDGDGQAAPDFLWEQPPSGVMQAVKWVETNNKPLSIMKAPQANGVKTV